jgi:hypothetical protein
MSIWAKMVLDLIACGFAPAIITTSIWAFCQLARKGRP